jgi:hypothetical protein
MTGKRRWILLGPKEASYMKTDAEVLAEMPTEALVKELRRRDEGWRTWRSQKDSGQLDVLAPPTIREASDG